MSKRQPLQTAYGLSDALLNIPLLPVVSTRAPATNDIKQLGSLWVNKETNAASILTKVVSNTATWIEFTDMEGQFLEFTATTHDANPAVLFVFDVPPASAITVYATIIAARANYTAGAAGLFELGARRTGIGNVVAVGAGVSSFDEDTMGGNPDAFMGVVPDIIGLVITGEAATQWNWKAQVTIVRLPF